MNQKERRLFLIERLLKEQTGYEGVKIPVNVEGQKIWQRSVHAESFLNNGISVEPQEHFGRSREYWIGWAVAYYQWYSSREYSHIFKVLSFEDLQKMYYTLHEADLTKFVDIVDLQMKEYFFETNLKRIRAIYGFTQAELAERSGVSLRSIQMYEQRNKNINKASADTMYRLAKVLGCTMEDLIEK